MADKKEITKFNSTDLSVMLHSGTEIARPFSRDIFIWSGYLKGCQYEYNIIEYTAKLKAGDRVKVVREPNNEYDGMAIMVKDLDGHNLGYIPRQQNKILANLMDAGKTIFGEINKIKYYKSTEDKNFFPWDMIMVDLYMED